MTSNSGEPILLQPLPERTTDRSATYASLLRELLDLVGAELPIEDESGVDSLWHHRARKAVGDIVTRCAEDASEGDPVPEQWYEPLMRAAILEPNPSYNRQFVKPAVQAFGRRRVKLTVLAYLDSDDAADIAGAARAWYWTHVPVTYPAGSDTPTAESLAEYEAFSDLRERYRHTALRRFVAVTDLDARRCILPGLPVTAALAADQSIVGTRAHADERAPGMIDADGVVGSALAGARLFC